MSSSDGPNRTLPTLVTLLVVAILLMTFDIRLQGQGVVGVLRGGTQTLIAPLQRAATIVVDPVADFFDGLADISSLRETNDALRAELAESQRRLAETEDALARLETLERLYDLDLDETDAARTPANVIGRPDQFDLAFQIDKGVNDGVIEGQPVVDVNGFVAGTVTDASPNTAIVVPITASRNQLTVLVGSQAGLLEANPGSSEMTLRVFDARIPVNEGDQVVTAADTFPPGLAVGEVVEEVSPQSTALAARVSPFVDVDDLRVVVVLAWPPDPTAATTTTTSTTTTTTVPVDTTDTTGEG